jgi:hypothetical protein
MSSMNFAFLEALFKGMQEGCSTTLHSFPGDPLTSANWRAVPWSPGMRKPILSPRNNNYTCVSAFFRAQDSKYYRRKLLWVSLHALMIDDLGTKLPMSDLLVSPSAFIETSPGNHQAWLFLDEPLLDINKADALINAMIETGISANADPGMKGVTRVARLPDGANGKAKLGKPFPSVLHTFNPEMRYSVQQIIDKYNLQLKQRANTSDVPIPRAGIDPERRDAIKWLKVLEHHITSIRAGYHQILCPWWEDHSDKCRTGTYFMEPEAGNAWSGGFNCHHGHCSDRDINDLIGWVRAKKDEHNSKSRKEKKR